MGGVVDVKKLADLNWKNVAGRVINCYSNNDWIVGYLYKLLFMLEDPCGIYIICSSRDQAGARNPGDQL